MEYYIKGETAKAQQIKVAFEKLGYNTGNLKFTSSQLYYTIEGKVELMCTKSLQNLIKTHPDYKELELPVQPKFKVGDWLVYENGDCFSDGSRNVQVQTVEKDRYFFTQNTNGSHKFIDNHCRLWSIQDAKDGDILISENGNPFIFCEDGGYDDDYDIFAYGGLNEIGEFYESYRKTSWTYRTSLKPATKEQRDLLFNKMKEAGYTWDEKKKELKKIKPHYDIANFKPFDKVLVRDNDKYIWSVELFSFYRNKHGYPFRCVGNAYSQCIPFNKETEHLLGTSDMPSEEYINW